MYRRKLMFVDCRDVAVIILCYMYIIAINLVHRNILHYSGKRGLKFDKAFKSAIGTIILCSLSPTNTTLLYTNYEFNLFFSQQVEYRVIM